jgi:hypothetical protein
MGGHRLLAMSGGGFETTAELQLSMCQVVKPQLWGRGSPHFKVLQTVTNSTPWRCSIGGCGVYRNPPHWSTATFQYRLATCSLGGGLHDDPLHMHRPQGAHSARSDGASPQEAGKVPVMRFALRSLQTSSSIGALSDCAWVVLTLLSAHDGQHCVPRQKTRVLCAATSPQQISWEGF